MEFSAPTVASLAAIAARYGVPADAVRPVAGGVANHAYALGNELFLRIPRAESFVRDLRKELAVIPVARAAGVRTPAIVDFDDSGSVLDAPYVVLERVRGTDLTVVELPDTAPAWHEVGRELARLHREVPAEPPDGVEPDDGGGDPRPAVGRLAEQGYLDPGTARWLTGWFDRLASRFPQDQPHVLLHGDVALHNLLVDPASGEFRALIDWGDAAWGPPGMEFAKLSLFQVAAVLAGYQHADTSGHARSQSHTGPQRHTGSHRPTGSQGHLGRPQGSGRLEDSALAASALWFHLSWGLAGLARRPRPGERIWTAPPASRLLGVLRFFASSPPAPWSTLT